MRFGYARVSTAEQNPAHQIEALLRAGVADDDIHQIRACAEANDYEVSSWGRIKETIEAYGQAHG